MKTLYNTLLEGLLDVDDQDIDNMSDEAHEHMLMDMWEHGFGIYGPKITNKMTYNSKKKIVKAKYGFIVYYKDGELVIKHGPDPEYKYSLDQWTVDGTVSFDCPIWVSREALLSGKLKYSMLCHVGKRLKFDCSTYKDYDALKNFFDVRPNKNCLIKFDKCPSNEVMQMPVWTNVAGIEMMYRVTIRSNDFDPFKYTDITAPRVRINNISKYFDAPDAKRITDLINKYGKSGGLNMIHSKACGSIEELIENNKNTKIFLSCEWAGTTDYCTLEHTGNINKFTHKEIVHIQTKNVKESQWLKV